MAPSKRAHSFETLNTILGSLLRVPRLEKIETLEWLKKNVGLFERKHLRIYYGMMLHLLRDSVPVKPMVDLLVEITDESVVTQSRVQFVSMLFVRKINSPSIGRLLQAMAEHSGPDIYVPPLGQKQPQGARIPLGAVLAVCGAGQGPPETYDAGICDVNTRVYQRLVQASRLSDADFADELAQLVPLVHQSGRLLLGIERCVYEYLAGAWAAEHGASRTQALQVIASAFFRYWPRLDAETLQTRLLGPLSRAQRSAAEVLIPHLWHFGAAAAPLFDTLVARARPAALDWHSERTYIRYMHIYQFYRSLPGRAPPPVVVADLIVRMKGYLMLCAPWSRAVPAVCATLEGQFSLVSTDDAAAHVDSLFGSVSNTDVLFSLANSPWLGAYPQRSYSRLKVETGAASHVLISSQRPASSVIRIDAASLQTLGLTLGSFCEQLVRDLLQEGVDLTPYLLDLDSLGA